MRTVKLSKFVQKVEGTHKHERLSLIIRRIVDSPEEKSFLYQLIKVEFNLINIFSSDELEMLFSNEGINYLHSIINKNDWKFLYYNEILNKKESPIIKIVEKLIFIALEEYKGLYIDWMNFTLKDFEEIEDYISENIRCDDVWTGEDD